MPICNKCGNGFPNYVKIEGKTKNISSRRYCLTCSPWGKHNTKQIHVLDSISSAWMLEPCNVCGMPYDKRKRAIGRTTCFCCINKHREKVKGDRVYGIVGESCWKCGYNKGERGRKILEFHHVVPEQKKFGLTLRHIGQLRWETIEEEMRKCVLLCPNCHREEVNGILTQSEILKIYTEKWAEIGVSQV